MDRRSFFKSALAIGGTLAISSIPVISSCSAKKGKDEGEADVIVIGGGLGGCATALAACRNGLKVILTEETAWLGGQSSAQGVPPDEHQWIETHGAPASYREYRRRIRDFYRENYPLTATAMNDPLLNPGTGGVSRLCHEPRVTAEVLRQMLLPYVSTGHLTIMLQSKAVGAETTGDAVDSVTVRDVATSGKTVLHGRYFIDATDLGELLPMTHTEYVTGAESRLQTGEMHAPLVADPLCNQAFTYCFAMDYIEGEDHTIPKPRDYERWKAFRPQLSPEWAPGTLLNEDYVYPSDPKTLSKGFFNPIGTSGENGFDWWNYRKIINKDNFVPGTFPSDITMVNWPQNDYFAGNIIDVSEREYERRIDDAKQLSLSLLYWLQTECPRRDGRAGWPGLRLRGDIFGTPDGLALSPYIRESRRIKAVTTVTEAHVGKKQRMAEAGSDTAFQFPDSVGIGFYNIDLHPTCSGVSYIDTPALPFQIPLGALVPTRTTNLIPACKNIGTTHITNGCYRLHPVEWSIGEAAGCLAAFAIRQSLTPRAVLDSPTKLSEFQSFEHEQGIAIAWSDRGR